MNASEVLRLPLREKLEIMKVLYKDLRERADSSDISQEWKYLLENRRARVGEGVAQILDWEKVKHTIGRP